MKRLIAPAIALVWGSGIVLRLLIDGPTPGSQAYETGQWFAVVAGVALIVWGAIALRQRLGERAEVSASSD